MLLIIIIVCPSVRALLLTYLLIYLLTYLLTYLLNYLLTPRSTDLLGKLTDSQLVKKFPALYGTRRLQLPATCLYPKPDQSSPRPHSTFSRSILLLSSHTLLGLPSGLFLSDFPTKTLYAHFSPPYVLHAPPISIFSICSPEKGLVSKVIIRTNTYKK